MTHPTPTEIAAHVAELKPMKAYIVYGGGGDFLSANLVLENGWPAFGHLCSHECFMRGDLIEHREERKAVFAAMGYQIEIVGEPIKGSAKSPPELLEKFRSKEWQAFADEYKATEERLANLKGAQ